MLCITKKRYLINRLRKQFEMFYVDQWEIENERQNVIRKQKKSKFELYSNVRYSYRRETYTDNVRGVQTRKCITQIRLLINFHLNKGGTKIYQESNGYANYVQGRS